VVIIIGFTHFKLAPLALAIFFWCFQWGAIESNVELCSVGTLQPLCHLIVLCRQLLLVTCHQLT